MENTLYISFNIIILISSLFVLYQIKKTIKQLEGFNYLPQLSQYEIERMNKEREFDNRINKLKNELANSNTNQEFTYSGYMADELHPNVHNLPHSIINYTPYDGEEVAE